MTPLEITKLGPRLARKVRAALHLDAKKPAKKKPVKKSKPPPADHDEFEKQVDEGVDELTDDMEDKDKVPSDEEIELPDVPEQPFVPDQPSHPKSPFDPFFEPFFVPDKKKKKAAARTIARARNAESIKFLDRMDAAVRVSLGLKPKGTKP
jgi:hypothetical protein